MWSKVEAGSPGQGVGSIIIFIQVRDDQVGSNAGVKNG